MAHQETAKNERENQINIYDEQLRGFRDKLKDLRSIHIEANKAVLLKRKDFDLKRKEMGNKVQPSRPSPEIDDS